MARARGLVACGPGRAVLLAALALLVACGPDIPDAYTPRAGDVLFQSLPPSLLADVIEGTTHSPFSHCGIVAGQGEDFLVLEAFQSVRATPLEDFLARGRGGAFSVYRFGPELAARVPAILRAAEAYHGRPYDMRYEPGDSAIYCSELVHLAVRDATGVEVGAFVTLGELDWEPHAEVIEQIEGGPPPLERPLLTPRALSEAPELVLALEHGW